MSAPEKQWLYTDRDSISVDTVASLENVEVQAAQIPSRRVKWPLFASLMLNLLLSTVILITWTSLASSGKPSSWQNDRSYSPAHLADERKDVVFETGFWNSKSPYIGRPTGETDRNWGHLYDFYLSRLTAEEARPLPNWTLPIPGDEDHYVIQLSVFHELHCLDQIRHALWEPNSSLGDDSHLKMPHLDHCIQVLRQSIQCHSDITPMPLVRDPVSRGAKWMMATKHTCRNFEKVRDWALQRILVDGIDYNTLVRDDPFGWGERVLEGYLFAENTTRF